MLARFLNTLFKRPGADYEATREALAADDLALKRRIAAASESAPEALYYLAADQDLRVRRAVAGNDATPAHADALLAGDADPDVRITLARKIARVAPGLDASEHGRLREMTLATLERLAADELPRVRMIVAEAIKSSPSMPPALIKRLARDAVEAVAAPVLEHSPLLSDADLIEIVGLTRISGVLAAVARRKKLSAPVCDAVVATLDVPAIAILLSNPRADLRAAAIDKICDAAAEAEAWHAPLAARPNLSPRLRQRIASFVAVGLIEQLAACGDVSADERQRLIQSAELRLAREPQRVRTHNAAARIAEATAKGTLDDSFVAEAADEGDQACVAQALAQLSGARLEIVEKILASGSPKAAIALVWRAGLPMRVAVKVQTHVQKLKPGVLMPARAGVGFPMTEDEMKFHLELFGVPF